MRLSSMFREAGTTAGLLIAANMIALTAALVASSQGYPVITYKPEPGPFYTPKPVVLPEPTPTPDNEYRIEELMAQQGLGERDIALSASNVFTTTGQVSLASASPREKELPLENRGSGEMIWGYAQSIEKAPLNKRPNIYDNIPAEVKSFELLGDVKNAASNLGLKNDPVALIKFGDAAYFLDSNRKVIGSIRPSQATFKVQTP